MSAVDGDGAGGVLDCGSACGECHDRAPPQQPDQPGFVVTGEAPIIRCRAVRYLMQVEQVSCGPAERGGWAAPLGKKATAVLDRALPALDRHELGAARFKNVQGATKAT